MKTALPLIILALTVLGLQAQQPIQRIAKKKAGAAHAKCVQCSHAPCDCGFSPSYYTSKPAVAAKAAKAKVARKKVAAKVAPLNEAKPAPKHPPLFTHWSRPRPQPVAPVTKEETAMPEVAAPLTEEERIADYLRRLEEYLAYFEGRELIGAAPARKLGFLFKRREAISPQTLIPTPRRAGAIPTRNVNQSLGFVPANSLVNSPRPANPLPAVEPRQTLGFEPGLVARNPFARGSRRDAPRTDGKPKFSGPPAYSGKPAFSGKPKFSGPPKFAAQPSRGTRSRPTRGRRR